MEFQLLMEEINKMTRETVIQNILTNYGQYISKAEVESTVDSGKEQGLSYDLIYLRLLVKIRMIILNLCKVQDI